MKCCSRCKIEKDISEFSKFKNSKDGLRSSCKSCDKLYREKNKDRFKEYSKKYREDNKDNIKLYRDANKVKKKNWQKTYYIDNKAKIKKQRKKYKEDNKAKIKKYSNIYREDNKDKLKKYAKIYREANRDKANEYYKDYREANRDKIKAYRKKWREANKDNINKKAVIKRKENPLYRMKHNLRKRTLSAFKSKGYKKSSKTQEMLGVDWEVCKAHIEKQFTEGMNWDNQGKWHIDHIIPLASAKNEDELMKLCHYRNLQPLWAEDNLKKNNKIQGQQTYFKL